MSSSSNLRARKARIHPISAIGMDEDSKKLKYTSGSGPWTSWNDFDPSQIAFIWILSTLLLSLLIVHHFHTNHRLPLPLAETSDDGLFSEERALKTLIRITESGPRVVGSKANEDITLKYILEEMDRISESAREHFQIEVSLQNPSGSFDIAYRGYLHIMNTYIRVHNIVIRVSLKSDAHKSQAILLGTHFDSINGSPGASDAGACVSVVLEVLRALVSSDIEFTRPLILVFNGAEEFGLLASHGFIAQHEWARSVSQFINLDAGGTGGKALLTQTGPHDISMAKLYAATVSTPHATVLAQDIFQSGVVPSDTDYRVYAGTGIPGLDIVYFRNGYLYHTTKDKVQEIPTGSLQHMGDIVLVMVQNLVTNSQFTRENGSAVFYSIGDRVMLVYSMRFALMVHTVVLLCSFYVLYVNMSVQVLNSAFHVFLSIVSGVVGAVAMGFTITCVLGAKMSWYKHPYMAFIIFTPPALVCSFAVMERWSSLFRKVPNAIHTLRIGSLLLWTVTLSVLTLLGIGSAYLALWWVLYHIIVSKVHKSFSTSFGVYLILEVIMVLVPLYLWTTPLGLVIDFVLPTTGRSGSAPSDIVIGFLLSFCLMVMVHGFWPLITSTNSFTIPKYICSGIVVVSLFLCWISFPYDAMHPKRVLLQHSFNQGIFNLRTGQLISPSDEERGLVYILGIDAIPLEKALGNFGKVLHVIPFREFDCLYPLALNVVTSAMLRYVAPPPYDPVHLIEKRRETMDDSLLVEIEVMAPKSTYATLTIYTEKVLQWSFDDIVSGSGKEYIIRFVCGDDSPYSFWIEIPRGQNCNLRFAASYMHLASPEIDQVMKELPEFADPVFWTSVVSNWIIDEPIKGEDR